MASSTLPQACRRQLLGLGCLRNEPSAWITFAWCPWPAEAVSSFADSCCRVTHGRDDCCRDWGGSAQACGCHSTHVPASLPAQVSTKSQSILPKCLTSSAEMHPCRSLLSKSCSSCVLPLHPQNTCHGLALDKSGLCSEEAEWSAMDTNEAGSAVYMGDNDGAFAQYDPRTSEPVLAPFVVQPRKFNTLHVRCP